MSRRALLIAALCAAACKTAQPAGDPSPAHASQPGPAPAPAAPAPAAPATASAAPANPSAGTAGTSHGAAAQTTAPRTPDPLAGGRIALGPFSAAAPAGWIVKPVTSSMRAAQFQVPGKPGGDAELIVYYFGAQGAGSVDDNLERWLGQFQQPDGKSSRDVANIEHIKLAGQDATLVSVAGRLVAPAMPGGAAPVDKPDQALLAAIVASPSGPYYFKLSGAKATVDASATAFRAMLGSLQLR
jgi:hypothetical protein